MSNVFIVKINYTFLNKKSQKHLLIIIVLSWSKKNNLHVNNPHKNILN